jgi:hypothetical protein
MSADAPTPAVVPALPGEAPPVAPAPPVEEKEYPIADFIDPVEWNWSKRSCEVRKALKEWMEQAHADY